MTFRLKGRVDRLDDRRDGIGDSTDRTLLLKLYQSVENFGEVVVILDQV
jgi:hypothetical protein